jgi:hypothetical protein
VLTHRLRPTLALLLLPVPAAALVVTNIALDRTAPPAVHAHLDEAPPGVDIHRPLSIAELRGKVRLDRYPGRPEVTSRLLAERRAQTTVADEQEQEQVSVPGEQVSDGDGEQLVEVADGPVPPGDPGLPGLTAHVRPSCTGTGTDGNRVQVIYAVEKGKTNRYQDLLPLLRSWVADVDDTFALSSQKTGGGLRVRWVHDNCVPVINAEVVPAGALTNGFSATVKELKARGYTSKARKYLVFADDAKLCGVGHMYSDSNKTSNLNDGVYPMFSRVDSGCWSFPDYWHSTAAHELMHNIGGVQDDAPNSTKAGHCNDEDDAMCYDDGGSASTMKQVCRDEGLFDCRNDDYFHAAPPAGSYLATRWNPADSSFLDRVATLAAAPGITVSGASSVRPGLATTLTATSTTPVSYTWSASPTQCLPGGKTASKVTVMCPAHYTGSVKVSVRGAAKDGTAATATRTLTLTTSSKASMTVRLAPSASSIYYGKSTRLTGTLRYGSAAVRGNVYLYAAPASGGSYAKVAGPVDTGADGAYAWTVAPKKSTRYAILVGYNSSGGWNKPPQGSTSIKVKPAPTKWSASVKTGRPDVVSGKLMRSTGTALTNRKVSLQYRSAGSSTWRTVGDRYTNSGGNVSYKVQPKRGTYYRWVYTGSTSHARSYSASKYVSY